MAKLREMVMVKPFQYLRRIVMGEKEKLGRIEPVEVHEVWPTEPRDFTPWLADNLEILAETLGMTLELEETEKRIGVGLFKADIVCRDINSGTRVLVENQLERSDHTHLGQILTYAAGLDSTIIVWVSPRFTEDHRAALDWLNEISNEEIQFFGLEIKVLKIGNSSPAPQFNIVSRPNNWTRGIRRSVADTPLQKLYREYWANLNQVLDDSEGPVRGNLKPQPANWMSYSIGKADFSLVAVINSQSRWIRTELYMMNKKDIYKELALQKNTIESELGTLDWEETITEGGNSRISCSLKEVDINNKDNWKEQHKWLAEKLNEFHEVFANRIKSL